MSIANLNEERKRKGLSIDELAKTANLAKSTVEKVLFGVVKNPRIDTIQAIERALGLAPTFTQEEQAQGAVNSPTVFSDRDLNTIGRINRAEDVLGFSYVDTVLNMLDLAVEEKLKK